MQKEQRQNTILSLVGTQHVGSQIELVDLLKSRGFAVTQASVSRDLDELGVVKAGGHYTLPQRETMFGNVTFDTAGDHMIVARCASGLASAITVRIDRQGFDEIAGTIAGDDTIFIAVRDRKSRDSVLIKLQQMLNMGLNI